MNARRVTAEKMIASSKGQIDVEMAEKFLADHGQRILQAC